jgi:CMP-N-acetylneuraminic acid synthetase
MRTPIIYAMIPARYGSTRLKMKNLALIDGKPMISYAIEAAIYSNVFDKVIINSEHSIFEKIAIRYGADFYHRAKNLGSSETRSDAIVFDFMQAYPEADVIVWVNPTSPFQSSNEIYDVVNHFNENNLDSLITVEEKQVHCNYEEKPVNYNPLGLFEQTQDLIPIEPFVYSIMMWRKDIFLSEYNKKGFALFCGKFGVRTVNKLSGIIIKTADDLKIADLLMRSINLYDKNYSVKYDKLVEYNKI